MDLGLNILVELGILWKHSMWNPHMHECVSYMFWEGGLINVFF